MSVFNKSQQQELKDYLYGCYIHDASIVAIQYLKNENMLLLEMENTVFSQKISVLFKDVIMSATISGQVFGRQDVVLSLTVEDDSILSERCFGSGRKEMESYIYFLLQMLSGNEIHIFANTVDVFVSEAVS